MSSCSFHASRPSVAACCSCGKLVCTVCNNEIEGKSYCPNCAEQFLLNKPPEAATSPAAAPAAAVSSGSKGINPLWWVAVFFLGWIGGLIAWLKNKDTVPAMSRFMLYGGIGWSALQILVAGIFLFTAVIAPAIGNYASIIEDRIAARTTSADAGAETAAPRAVFAPEQPDSTTVGADDAAPAGGPAQEDIVIDVPEPVPQATPEPPDYQTTTLVTKKVEPSAEKQVVGYEDEVTVKIPANALEEPQQLTISVVTNAPSPGAEEGQSAVYDISFEKQQQFPAELEMVFSYETADSSNESADEAAPAISYWDEEAGSWIPMPFSVDSENHTLTVLTDHNGLWKVHRQLDSGKVILVTEHFIIYFNATDFNSTKLARFWELEKEAKLGKASKLDWTPELRAEYLDLLNDPEVSETGSYKGKLSPQDHHYYNDNPGVPQYIVDIAVYAEQAWKQYKDLFHKEPILSSLTVWTSDAPLLFSSTSFRAAPYNFKDGRITTLERFPIYVDAQYSDPLYYARSRSICLGYSVMGDLRGVIYHELFHAVQNKDYWLASRQSGFGALANLTGFRSADLWWLESTADYAAYRLALGLPSSPTGGGMKYDYFKEDFFSNGNPDVNHPYINAYFFDFLKKRQDVSFVSLYNAVAGSYRTRLTLDEYLKQNSRDKLGLHENYHEWVKYVLFDESSPIVKNPDFRERSLDTSMQNLTINLGSGLTSGYQGILPAVSGAGKRTLIVRLQDVRWQSEMPFAWVDVFRLSANERTMSGLKVEHSWDINKGSWPEELCSVDLKAGDALYIVVTRYGGGPSSFTINIADEPSLYLKCAAMQAGDLATPGQPMRFERVGSGLPSSASRTWYIDGKAVADKGDVLNHTFWDSGMHTVQTKASWSPLRSVESDTCIFSVGNPAVSVESPVASGEKVVAWSSYNFTQQSKYVPAGAEYRWYSNGMDIGGDQNGVSYVFENTGTYEIKVRAQWAVPGAVDRGVDDTKSVTVEPGFGIVAEPIVGNVGEPSKFGISGEVIPATAGFSWEFGKGEGGVSTTSKDTKATHTYQKAGTYTVSVNVIDRNTKKTVLKTSIQYVVFDTPFVEISPRPSTAKLGEKTTFSYKTYNLPKLYGLPRSDWKYTCNGVPTEAYNLDTLTVNFDKPGTYTISVVVIASNTARQIVRGKDGIPGLSDSVSITVGADTSKDTPSSTAPAASVPQGCLKAGEKYVCPVKKVEITLLSVTRVQQYNWTKRPEEGWGYMILRYQVKNNGSEEIYGATRGDFYLQWDDNGMHRAYAPYSGVHVYYKDLKRADDVAPGAQGVFDEVFSVPNAASQVYFDYSPKLGAGWKAKWLMNIE